MLNSISHSEKKKNRKPFDGIKNLIEGYTKGNVKVTTLYGDSSGNYTSQDSHSEGDPVKVGKTTLVKGVKIYL